MGIERVIEKRAVTANLAKAETTIHSIHCVRGCAATTARAVIAHPPATESASDRRDTWRAGYRLGAGVHMVG